MAADVLGHARVDDIPVVDIELLHAVAGKTERKVAADVLRHLVVAGDVLLIQQGNALDDAVEARLDNGAGQGGNLARFGRGGRVGAAGFLVDDEVIDRRFKKLRELNERGALDILRALFIKIDDRHVRNAGKPRQLRAVDPLFGHQDVEFFGHCHENHPAKRRIFRPHVQKLYAIAPS